jgi:hypothetical protein
MKKRANSVSGPSTSAGVSRRDFLQKSLLATAGVGVGMAVAAPSIEADSAISETERVPPAPDPDVDHNVDVLVVGGGSAGVIAAIQAARAGAKTLLVERGSQLGGTITTGGVSFPGLFDAWGKQVIAGIGWELVEESVKLDGGALPDFSRIPQRHWQHQIQLNPFVYAILAEEKCTQAGVEIAYYEFPQYITKSPDGWRVDCAGFGTRRHVFCKQIIDCTGGADIVGMLNLPRLREAETMPGSMLFSFDPHNPGRGAGAPLTPAATRHYVHGADSSNSRTVTAANLTGRKNALDIIRRSNGNRRLMHMQPEVSFRESYRIDGEAFVTVEDYRSGRVFEDAVSYAFYPVDQHTARGVVPQPLDRGVVPTVPLRALIPKGSRNIIVAGRSISSDRLANSGLRVQAACMAMGQAAAAAATLAARLGTTPLAVPLPEIHALLREHGAIVPEIG